MNDVKIYNLIADDIEDIIEISVLSFPTAWVKEAFDNELKNNLARYVVAKIDEKTIGYGGMWIILDECHITNIAIHPDYRQLGIASLILESLITIGKSEGCSAMTLEVRKSNFIAQKLYKKFGFIEEGLRKKYYSDNKEDAVIMWKRNLDIL